MQVKVESADESHGGSPRKSQSRGTDLDSSPDEKPPKALNAVYSKPKGLSVVCTIQCEIYSADDNQVRSGQGLGT